MANVVARARMPMSVCKVEETTLRINTEAAGWRYWLEFTTHYRISARDTNRFRPRPPRLTLGKRIADSSFLGIATSGTTRKKSRVAILPIPFEQTVSGERASADGAIYRHPRMSSSTTKPGGREQGRGHCDIPPRPGEERCRPRCHRIRAAGIIVGEVLSPSAGTHRHQALVGRTCRYPDLSVLQIDAHSDLRSAYQGSPEPRLRDGRGSANSSTGRVEVIRPQCEEEAKVIVEKNIDALRAQIQDATPCLDESGRLETIEKRLRNI